MREKGISSVPLHLFFGQDEYGDYDLTHDQFFEKMEKSRLLPTTSMVTTSQFHEVVERYRQQGDECVIATFSSAMSGTFNSARLVAEQFDGVTVYDSKALSLGLGLMLIRAADMAAAGEGAQEIVKALTDMRAHMHHYFIVGGLDHLRRGGRLSAPEAFVANMLSIKPVLTISDDGRLVPETRIRGFQKAMNYVLGKMEEHKGGTDFSDTIIGLNYTKDIKLLNQMEEQIRRKFTVGSILEYSVGNVVSSHAGPDCVAVYYQA